LEENAVGTLGLRAVIATGRLNQLQSRFSTWFSTFIAGNIPFELVLISGQEDIRVRVVQGLSVVERVTLKQVKNAYFDRAR
jgi:hypothetical protein